MMDRQKIVYVLLWVRMVRVNGNSPVKLGNKMNLLSGKGAV